METASPQIDGCGKLSLVEEICEDVSASAKQIALGAGTATVVGCTLDVGAAAGAKISSCQSNGMAESM